MMNLKCYEIWADNVFLGYEYAESQHLALINSRTKYGDPRKWSVIEYQTVKLTPGE